VIKFAADENFDDHILHALSRRYPQLDIVRIQDTALYGATDDKVLQWCADEQRIVLTHDVSTLIAFVYRRVEGNLPMPGVWEVARDLPRADLLNDLAVLIECGDSDDFQDLVVFVPLR
jgi:hypothetical protein